MQVLKAHKRCMGDALSQANKLARIAKAPLRHTAVYAVPTRSPGRGKHVQRRTGVRETPRATAQT